ncbi:helix-turn-helix domain-containing protein [Natronococcus sp. A-GB7]|uniref:helix-turn-helix domain-containing protein n=1 Tax=Natronococcus sp. A-GB7 TaxID=3037649 RepID=UPI00241D5293|nr:helix-turn-helix domain-containing protein [Natronococcus sp. A-GB7]MDG5818813.1 helix-turn-helix domain-containing protein [Natronococcus sp. A-GB7]
MTDGERDLEALMLVDEPEFERVLECVFGVQPHESRTYTALSKAPGSTTAELATDLDRDRSSVSRSLGTLEEKALVERTQRLLDGGGYVYQYTALPLPETKSRMHRAVDEWSEQVHERIEEFGE